MKIIKNIARFFWPIVPILGWLLLSIVAPVIAVTISLYTMAEEVLKSFFVVFAQTFVMCAKESWLWIHACWSIPFVEDKKIWLKAPKCLQKEKE